MIYTTQSDIVDLYHVRVQTLLVGTCLTYQDKVYEVVGTATYQGAEGQMFTLATIRELDDESEFKDVPPITLNLDESDIELM